VIGAALGGLIGCGGGQEARAPVPEDPPNLPVDVAALRAGEESVAWKVRNLVPLEQLHSSLLGDRDGLRLDLSKLGTLNDGSTVDPRSIGGIAWFGPYPFESQEVELTYRRYREDVAIGGGRAILPVGKLLIPKLNSEGWTDCGTVAVRLQLQEVRAQLDRVLGTYDTFATFCRTETGFEKLPTVVEGPLVHRVTSDDPRALTVSFVTDRPVGARVEVESIGTFASEPATRHEVELTGLEPDALYRYRLVVGDWTSRWYPLETAPTNVATPLRFAYVSDSREGPGGGMQSYMGVNHATLERLAAIASLEQARFLLVGGDLVNGYTLSVEDFRAQLYAWKQALSGFWSRAPVYPVMGNHEALLRRFVMDDGRAWFADRWPYATDSAEAVFAEAFVNPTNAPQPDDPRRPTYAENVYSFRFGPMFLIAFNNNYWRSRPASELGGSPEGFIFDDQLRWIEEQLAIAEEDATVRYVLLFAQEPVFPLGGHVDDAMWYDGDNTVRAHTFTEGKLVPANRGVIEVRNRLVRAVARSTKVAAVLAGDEHAYCRVRIDGSVPIGDPARDDLDGDGRIAWRDDEPARPLQDLERPVWYITCGGGGAPYYAEEHSPWAEHWQGRSDERQHFLYSSQESLVLFEATADGLRLRAVNLFGETIDTIDNLMAIAE
jgi:hypothetical protein